MSSNSAEHGPQSQRLRNFLVAATAVAATLSLEACDDPFTGNAPVEATQETPPAPDAPRPEQPAKPQPDQPKHHQKPKPETHNFSAKSWHIDFGREKSGQPPRDLFNYEIRAGYNSEAEFYTSNLRNARVKDGALIIQAHREQMGGKGITSAFLKTQGLFSFKYGRLAITMRVPSGLGTWPALWLMPESGEQWPQGGEVDIVEILGKEPGIAHTNARTPATVNSGGDPMTHSSRIPGSPYAYHTYAIDKRPGQMTFSVDGKPTRTIHRGDPGLPDWPFEQRYYLIANLAMGGDWGGQIPSTSKDPWTMSIRSIDFQQH